ncbi:MAG: prepilin-type N-terminal cleavage/methylation domain-containing protein [Puniceicoccales bacterium]|jgi:prepilin-type N-terminal cleavage/methylation domain-containing protein|nr:prepilin-type N-terminal cleavage/methylation domain-containing protein [Puniceicoccales bacterium]
MKRRKIYSNPRKTAAFTLIELLTVLAIIGLMASVVLGIRPNNPAGMEGARAIVTGMLRGTQAKAAQSQNPDINPEKNPLYNIRARLLVLKDVANPEQHLRRMRIIIGGTRLPESTQPSDYFWYSVGSDTTLPSGIHMVSPDETNIEKLTRRSHITNRNGLPNTMRLNLEPSNVGQSDGTGDREWYFYEFNDDGTSNMNFASFTFASGNWEPGSNRIVFPNEDNIAGVWITPNGSIVPFLDVSEIDKQQPE